jgi:hypothetical protein
MAAMGHDEDGLAQLPEKRKVSLYEYRKLHPEANPITTEQRMIHETRTEKDGRISEWERHEGFREAVNRVQPCPRCNRPLLVPSSHIVCKPVEGGPVAVTVERRGAGWYESLAEAPDPEPDEEERDFAADPQAEVEARVRAEMLAVSGEASAPGSTTLLEAVDAGVASFPEAASTMPETVYGCFQCDYRAKSQHGLKIHVGRSHKGDA